MIGTIFEFAGQVIEVRIDNTNCLFRTGQFGGGFAPIDGLKLDKSGVIKEFPELKDNEDWKKEAIKRFKAKIKKMNTEKQRMNYIILDLSKHGYKPMAMQESGKRLVRFD